MFYVDILKAVPTCITLVFNLKVCSAILRNKCDYTWGVFFRKIEKTTYYLQSCNCYIVMETDGVAQHLHLLILEM